MLTGQLGPRGRTVTRESMTIFSDPYTANAIATTISTQRFALSKEGKRVSFLGEAAREKISTSRETHSHRRTLPAIGSYEGEALSQLCTLSRLQGQPRRVYVSVEDGTLIFSAFSRTGGFPSCVAATVWESVCNTSEVGSAFLQ